MPIEHPIAAHAQPAERDVQKVKQAMQDLLDVKLQEAISKGKPNTIAKAIAAKHLFEISMDKDEMEKVLKQWIVRLDRQQPLSLYRYTKMAQESLDKRLKSNKWRKYKDGEHLVNRMAKGKHELIERFKAKVIKAAFTWGCKEYKAMESVEVLIQDGLKEDVAHGFLRWNILEQKDRLIAAIGKQVEQLEHPERFTREETLEFIFQQKDTIEMLQSFVLRELITIFIQEGMYLLNVIVSDSSEMKEEPVEESKKLRVLQKTFPDLKTQLCIPEIWGEYTALAKFAMDCAPEQLTILNGMINANTAMMEAADVLDTLGHELAVAKKTQHKAVAEKAGELEKAKVRILHLEKQVEQMRKARGLNSIDTAQVPTKTIQEDVDKRLVSKLQSDLEESRKTNQRLSDLLRSILSSSDGENAIHDGKEISIAETKQKRGVIIGGHWNLTSKMRKELPNSTFYSADAKTVDEELVRGSDYVLFITGYLNHCLSGNALRLVRQYDIPCGYTDKTNVQLVIEDIKGVFG